MLIRKTGGTRFARPSAPVSRRTPVRLFQPNLAPLEPRTLLSSLPSTPTNEEQYMLQLINRARANPQVEAARIVGLTQTDPVLKDATAGVDLSKFVQQASSTGSLPPLAFNTRLIAAARDHDQTILSTNNQTHAPSGFLVTGTNGLVAGDGQVYYPVGQSSWSTGENVFAYSQNVGGSNLKDYVNYYYAGLMIDWGNPDFGHLKNILAPGPAEASAAGTLPFSEIGIGLLSGTPTTAPPANPENPANKGLNVGPVILTQEFAWKAGNAFLTGAVYRDLDNDNFYSPGEGLTGVTIRAVGTQGQGTFSTQTWSSGGYSLALPPGTYAVTESGPAAATRSTTITIGQDNVGWNVKYAPSSNADQPIPGDYDGDGKVDIAVFHEDSGTWYIRSSSLGNYPVQFGQPGDIPVPGKYDGGTKTELALYRPSTSQWFILQATGVKTVKYGTPGEDVPVPADYDGDGKTDIAIYKPSQGVWYVQQSTAGPRGIAFGQPNVDVPVPADYDGDHKADFVVYRPTTGQWLILGSSSGGNVVQFGQPGTDIPVPADYDGDGRTDLAVYRTTTAEWLIIGTNSPGRIVVLGQPGSNDTPVPADYDGDHRADLAIYRPSEANWYLKNTHIPTPVVQFGQPGVSTRPPNFISPIITNYGVSPTISTTTKATTTTPTKNTSVPSGPKKLAQRKSQTIKAKKKAAHQKIS